jgi:DnaJ-class molecular chaperone
MDIKQPMEECYRCGGEAGFHEVEGPHDVWMPCYRCGNTGLLPVGSRAADDAKTCKACEGEGVLWVDHPEDGRVSYNCRNCGNTGRVLEREVQPDTPSLEDSGNELGSYGT